MKITEENKDYPVDFIEVKSAIYIGNCAIRVFFNDGINNFLILNPS